MNKVKFITPLERLIPVAVLMSKVTLVSTSHSSNPIFFKACIEITLAIDPVSGTKGVPFIIPSLFNTPPVNTGNREKFVKFI